MKNIKTYEDYTKGTTFKDYINDKYSQGHELSSFIMLDCQNYELIDLDGIEQFTNLKKLSCFNNRLTSLKGVENLIDLNGISCRINFITSLEPLKNLNNLVRLFCYDNRITSLKGVENLTKLEYLHCQNNPIDWVDYIDKKRNIWYTILPKSIESFISDKFSSIKLYWEFIEKNQPVAVSRKFNF